MPVDTESSDHLPDEDKLRAAATATAAAGLLEASTRRELEQGRILWCDVERAIQEPRQGRKAGPLRLEDCLLAPARQAGTVTVEGHWRLPWPAHPVPGAPRTPFEEHGSFRCEVSLNEEGCPQARAVTYRSELFEGLLSWVEIPAGEFLMGSPENDREGYKDEKPQHWKAIEAFSMSATPITIGQYAAVTGRSVGEAAADHPVTEISWHDAIDFCNALSRLAGREPCYLPLDGWMEWRREADGFRLPAEAEWEYACRAGTTTRYSFGDDRKRLGEFAWFAGNSNHRLHSVAQRRPNLWGLHDMHGNVWEWVWDRYGWYKAAEPSSATAIASSARRPSLLGNRVVRGGSFRDAAWALRSAVRLGHSPGRRDWIIGFRCASPPHPSTLVG